MVLLGVALPLVRERCRGFTFLDWVVLLYLLGPLPSFWATTDLPASLIQYAKHLYLGAVYLVFSAIARSRERAAWVLGWLGATGVVIAALSLAAALAHALGAGSLPFGRAAPIPYLGATYRLWGTFSSWGFLANYLTLVLAIVVSWALSRRHLRALLGALVVTLTAGLTFSQSLGGVLVAGLVSIWPFGNTRAWRAIRATALIAVLAMVLVLDAMLIVSIRDVRYRFDRNPAIAPPGFAHGFQDAAGAPRLNVEVSYNVMSYQLLKRIAIEAFRRQPWTGVGLGRFSEETERAYQQGTLHATYRRIDPHSTPLGRLAETGVFGGVTLALLWLGVAVAVILLARDGAAWGWPERAVTAGILGLLVNSIDVDIMNFRFLWIGLAVLGGALARIRSTAA